MDEKILTVEEVAGVLRLDPANVRKLLRENKLKGFKVQRGWRIKLDDLDLFIKENSNFQ